MSLRTVFQCPQCGSRCWGSGVRNDGTPIGVCQICTGLHTTNGGCGFQWERSEENDRALGIDPVKRTP